MLFLVIFLDHCTSAWCTTDQHRSGKKFKEKRVYQFSYTCKLKNSQINVSWITTSRGLQARVSRQVMTSMADKDSDEERNEPERMSLIDLKHRGKKKAIVPINRVRAVLGRKYMHVCLLRLQLTPCQLFATCMLLPVMWSLKRMFIFLLRNRPLMSILNMSYPFPSGQIMPEPCSRGGPRHRAEPRTAASWFLTRTSVRRLWPPTPNWSPGLPRRLRGPRKTSRSLRSGATWRYESRCRCRPVWAGRTSVCC